MVGNFVPKSNDYFSVSSGEGFGDNCGRGLLLLIFNGGEGLLRLGTFGNCVKVFGPRLFAGFHRSAIPDPIPIIGGRCMEGGHRGWSWMGGRASTFRVGVSWFVGVGVGWLWVQLADFSSELCHLLLKLGDLFHTSILGGRECSFHVIKVSENLLHDVIVGLSEHCRLAKHGRAEGVLGEGSVGAFVQGRGPSREYGLLRVLLRARGASVRGKDSLFREGRRS
jgi:hypothetical protein